MGGYAQGAFITSFVSDGSIASGNTVVDCAIAIGSFSDASASPRYSLFEPGGKVTTSSVTARDYFQLPVYANDAARTSAIPTPAAGMMVFMTAGTSPSVTNKAVVYDSTAWVALH